MFVMLVIIFMYVDVDFYRILSVDIPIDLYHTMAIDCDSPIYTHSRPTV